MKRAILFGAICLMAIEATAQLSFGTPEKINKDWMFTLENPISAQSKELNLSAWKAIDLPHDWSIREQLSPNLASSTGYLPGGIGWYRKSIDIPAHKQDQKVYLYFEGVYNRSELFVNGTSIGKRPNGYISFMYDITPYVTFGKPTQIAMKVDHSQSADSRWYTGSGIYRDAWIVYANPIHIAQWGVYAQPKRVTTKEATLQVEVEVSNNSNSKGKIIVTNELYSSNNKVVAKSSNSLSIESGANSTTISDLKVSNPQLWDIDNPNLYKLKTTITKDGKIIDQTTTNTGFRTYEFDPNRGFALNGKWTKVKGVCIHHDAGVLGSAVPKEVWKRRLINLKKLGVNAIRTSHNPQATALYELCDELGLLVMNEAFDEWEFPKRKWIEGWNRGTPGYQGSYDYFEEWAERDLADMVRRDRNHTSIFAWSIGNEVDYPNDPYSHPVLAGGSNTGFTQPIFGGYKSDAPDAMRLGDIAKRLTAVVKKYDNSRPVTAGLAGVAMSNQTEYPNALDIAGYNYTENRYQIDHEKYPNRIIYGSENRHEHEAWKYVRDNEHIFGQFLWTGIDYLGESGAWPSRGFYSGLLDFGGFIKPRGFFRQSLWSSEPMAYIGTYPLTNSGSGSDVWSALLSENNPQDIISMDAWPIWNYKEGESIRVVCYTNSPEAELLLNGEVVGKRKIRNDENSIIHWDIPYRDGTLEVRGLDSNGRKQSHYQIKTSKAPYAINIEKVINSTESGLVEIVIQVVDENGVMVMLSDNEITCHINGKAKLLGLEASNNSDMSDYTDNKQRVFNGKLLAYIQTDTNSNDTVKVKFTSPWLKEADVEIGR